MRIVHEEPGTHSQTQSVVGIVVYVGGAYETKKSRGVSHLLEHVCFRGTSKYSKNEISNLTSQLGNINAQTTWNYTLYYMAVPHKHVSQAIDILNQIVFHPLLREEDIKSELQIVKHELSMYQDVPGRLLLEMTVDMIYQYPVGSGTGGWDSTLNYLDAKFVKEFHRKHYTTKNSSLVVIAPKWAFRSTKLISPPKFTNPAQLSFPRVLGPAFFKINTKRHFKQKHISITFVVPCDPSDHALELSVGIVCHLLGGDMDSVLFKQVREEQNCTYQIKANNERFGPNILVIISLSTFDFLPSEETSCSCFL